MVIDTSALIAVLPPETGWEAYQNAIDAATVRLLSVASVMEATMILEGRLGGGGIRDLDVLIQEASLEVRGIDLEQLAVARDAFRRFGKGRHAAGLNFGDCFSYALARVTGEALPYKGADFARTDVESALA